MSKVDKKFRYSLDALVKKNACDISALRLEEKKALEALERKSGEVQEIISSINNLEQDLRKANQENSSIVPEKYTNTRDYLDRLHEILRQTILEVDKARAVTDGVLDQLKQTSSVKKGLENHKARTKKHYERERARAEFKESDGIWLSRRKDTQ